MVTGLARNPQAPELPPYLRLIGRFFRRHGFLQSKKGGNGQNNDERIKNIFKGKEFLCPHQYPPALFLEVSANTTETPPHGSMLADLLPHTLQD